MGKGKAGRSLEGNKTEQARGERSLPGGARRDGLVGHSPRMSAETASGKDWVHVRGRRRTMRHRRSEYSIAI
jgi:hypothetical protein